jgi:hypothetical protein
MIYKWPSRQVESWLYMDDESLLLMPGLIVLCFEVLGANLLSMLMSGELSYKSVVQKAKLGLDSLCSYW